MAVGNFINSKPTIRLYNSSFELQAVIDDYKSVSYARAFYSAGECTLDISTASANASLIERDMFIWFGTDTRDFYVITEVANKITEDDPETISVTGYEAKYIFHRRIVRLLNDTTAYADEDYGESVIKNLVNYQCGPDCTDSNRIFSCLLIDTDAATGKTYSLSTKYTNLYDNLVTIATQSGIGWYLDFDADASTLTLKTDTGADRYQGQTDNTICILSVGYDSVKNATLTNTSDSYANLVYVGGSGSGSSRSIKTGYSDDTEPSDLDRFEAFDNASSITLSSELETEATNKLYELNQTFNADVSGIDNQSAVYKTDYNVGDFVTVKVGDTFVDSRILSVTLSWSYGDFSLDFEMGQAQKGISGQIASLTYIATNDDALSETGTNTSTLIESEKSFDLSSADYDQTAAECIYSVLDLTGTLTADRVFTLYLDTTRLYGKKSYTLQVSAVSDDADTDRTITVQTDNDDTQAVAITVSSSHDTYSYKIMVNSSGDVIDLKAQADASAATTAVDAVAKVSGSLSLASIGLQATSDGTVSDYSDATGTFRVKYNKVYVTGDGPVYSVVSQTNLTGTINTDTGVYAVTALTADSGVLELQAVYEGETIVADFSVTKSYAGKDSLSINLSAQSVSVNATYDGVVSDYTGTGTDITVSAGNDEVFTFVDTLVDDSFIIGTPVLSTTDGITVGDISGQDTTTATIADHSGLLSTLSKITITYPLTVQWGDSTQQSYNVVQTITKTTDGTDGYTISTDVAAVTFSSDSDGNITDAQSVTITVSGLNGTTVIPVHIGDIDAVDGLTITKSFQTVTITAEAGTSLADNGSFVIPVYLYATTPEFVLGESATPYVIGESATPYVIGEMSVSDTVFNKTITWSKTYDGEDGSTYTLESDSASFTKDRSGTVTPSTITISSYKDGEEYAGRYIIYTSTDGSTYTSVYESTADMSSYTYTIPTTGISAIKVELYGAGGFTNKVATEPYAISYDASVAPIYWGAVTTMPTSNLLEGDTVLWIGSSGTYTSGYVYMYNGSSWDALDYTDTEYASYYMDALSDILSNFSTSTGYFDAVFCGSFFANSASISALQTKTITLTTSGVIKSANYVADTTGVYISYDGSAEFNSDTHIGGDLTVSGSATITGSLQSENYSSSSYTGWYLPASSTSSEGVNVNYIRLKDITAWGQDSITVNDAFIFSGYNISTYPTMRELNYTFNFDTLVALKTSILALFAASESTLTYRFNGTITLGFTYYTDPSTPLSYASAINIYWITSDSNNGIVLYCSNTVSDEATIITINSSNTVSLSGVGDYTVSDITEYDNIIGYIL